VYQRGIDIIQVPTTLLAQVDSSVGGKVGVNHPAGKNMIGAFHQPRLVFSDSGVLATLPARELVCGLGEVIKYGIISDRSLFDDLETRLDDILALEPDAVAAAVARCCTIKAAVVKGDEREQAPAEGRAILNFGHTVGHSIESAMHYRNIKHGEAVLLGMLIEARIACRMGLLAAPEEGRIGSLIRRLQLPRVLPGLGSGELFALMAHDKKVRENKIRFILPTAVGSVRMVDDVPRHIVTQSIDELKKTFRPGNRS
jgi:3-dehydroquinate synthase